jgi:hypothetical protein
MKLESAAGHQRINPIDDICLILEGVGRTVHDIDHIVIPHEYF